MAAASTLVASGEALPTKRLLDIAVQTSEGLAKAHGAALIAQLRAVAPDSRVLVLNWSDSTEVQASGADAYARKTFRPHELIDPRGLGAVLVFAVLEDGAQRVDDRGFGGNGWLDRPERLGRGALWSRFGRAS